MASLADLRGGRVSPVWPQIRVLPGAVRARGARNCLPDSASHSTGAQNVLGVSAWAGVPPLTQGHLFRQRSPA